MCTYFQFLSTPRTDLQTTPRRQLGIDAIDSIGTTSSCFQDLPGDDVCLLGKRSLLQHVLGVMRRMPPISVPVVCDVCFSISASDVNVSKIACHRELQSGAELSLPAGVLSIA